MPTLRGVQESEGPHNGTGLSCSRRDPMAGTPQPCGEELGRHDEGGRVGSEVGEEEGEGIQHDERCVTFEVVVIQGQDEHEEGHEEEAAQLDDPSADDVHKGNCEPVAGHGGAEGDESLRARYSENFLERTHCFGRWEPADGREHVLLEQVLGVEGYVEEEPCAGGAEELQTVSLGELGGEEGILPICTHSNMETVKLIHGEQLMEKSYLLFELDRVENARPAKLLTGCGIEDWGALMNLAEIHLQNPAHINSGLLVVLGNQCGVSGSLRHLHAVVEGQESR